MTTSVQLRGSKVNSFSAHSAINTGASSTRQYARLVSDWVRGIGLDPRASVRIHCVGQRQR